MPSAWHRILDFTARYLQPGFAFVALVTGTLISFRYDKQRTEFPKWQGLFDFLESGAFFWIFVLSAAALFLSGIALSRRERTMIELKSRIQKHMGEIDEIGNNIINVFDGLLLNLGRKLGLDQGDQVRLSLYVHDAQRKIFVPCGRYSPNPVYSSPGRTSYPDNQGCIFEGWKNGWHFDNRIPASGTARKAYNRTNYGIPDETNASIRMMSCLYAAKRLDNSMGQPVAVLVVEATSAEAFDDRTLQGLLNGAADDFARMVHTLRGYIPNPARALESGL